MRRRTDSQTIDLFAQERTADKSCALSWPESGRFPLNANGRHVLDHVWDDLLASQSPLIVTGYAGLDRFITFLEAFDNERHARILFGHEPFPARRERYDLSGQSFTAEAERYWLQRGMSLMQSKAIMRALDALKTGRVRARYLASGTRMHAKLYCGDWAATLGSSNFTDPGLQGQHEANARFSKRNDTARFNDTWRIAENYWQLGHGYNDALIELLEKLLKIVSWPEAIARACAELLEGEWAEGYLRESYLTDSDTLWPSQKQGIAQALYVLSNQGSVLIADATGAGKTRMGTYLIGAIRDNILRQGRLRQGKSLMVCPPAVMETWERESTYGGVALDVRSHGKLSHTGSRGHELSIELVRRAQVLCVDEGHNFLNFRSNRTQQLLRNMADHVVLLTATPINRGVSDLLRIADMLGADNLSPETLQAFDKMLGVTNLSRSLTEEEINTLRHEIQTFTVRRTKRVLNKLIDREPEAYRDRNGNMCRFPEHVAKIYPLNETDQDRRIAQRISELTDALHGLTHFVKALELPAILRHQGVSEDHYLQGRLNSAKKLARFMVTCALRSSRAALIEHIEGTEAARESFGIKNFDHKTATGNTIEKLQQIRSKLPENKLSIALPDWLTHGDRHAQVVDADIAVYKQIAVLVRQMTDSREKAKARLLTSLIKKHKLLLAFDSRPITLANLRQTIGTPPGIRCQLVWGDGGTSRDQLLRTYAHGSTEEGVIGLCSDSVAEGVNLQQASALVHLDMPTVVRIAEQRVGRVDRLDSPHDQIEAWWPQDAPEFALTSDERFIERYETVERLLGSNMPLPEHLQPNKQVATSAEEMIEQFEKNRLDNWDGIDDAFAPVRRLVEGDEALVDTATYERYRHVTERVLSRVSLVGSATPWAFFCISAGSFAAPRWIFLPGYNADPISGLADVTAELRARLNNEAQSLSSLDNTAARILNRFLQRLACCERLLLPRKKQRALKEMEQILDKLIDCCREKQDQDALDHLLRIKKMLQNPPLDNQPDWDEVATRWLDVIRPVWFEKLRSKKRKPLLLADVRKDLLKHEIWLIKQIRGQFQSFPGLEGPDTRISACIVGVSGS